MDRFVVRENLQPQTVSQQAGRKSAKTGTRRYLTEWKRQFTWVHYHALKERVFCEICSKASESNVVSALSSADQLTHSSYVVDGFCQWGKAVERFRSHEGSNYHRSAVEALAATKQGINVVAACSAGKLKQMKDARTALLKILSSVNFLCMQGLAVRGHTDADSNLRQLLKLRSHDVPELNAWLERTSYKWISHDIVNEMIELMAHAVLRRITQEIRQSNPDGFYTIMLDETSDISIREQVSSCFRFVSATTFEIHEVFVGFYCTDSTQARTLLDIVKDICVRLEQPINKCRGQCYDGAANVAGIRQGLQALFLKEEPRALFVHCLAHTLNLGVQDIAHNCSHCRNFLSFIADLIAFVRNSPKRLAWFEKIAAEENNGKVGLNYQQQHCKKPFSVL